MFRRHREMQLVLGRGLTIEVEVHFALGLDRELGKLPVPQNLVVGIVGSTRIQKKYPILPETIFPSFDTSR